MKKEREKRPGPVAVGGTIASAWGISILKEQIRKTGRLGIPSLGIELVRENLLEENKSSEPPQEKPEK